MTPAARVAAAIEVLDKIQEGQPAEAALIAWARGSRFAGSKDRAAIRDHVFDVLRRWRSTAALGGAETGRGRMIGLLRQQGADLSDVFSGEGHAPQCLSDDELTYTPSAMSPDAQADWPEWLWPQLVADFGADAQSIAVAQQDRAQVFLRVNRLRSTVEKVLSALQSDDIDAHAHPDVEGAIVVTGNPRRIQQTRLWDDGHIELQDAASQMAIDRLGVTADQTVLDYCAGGGGKSLALAAFGAQVTAHDADVGRMKDIPARAARAGTRIKTTNRPNGTFDLVFCDAPCSGSGTWRRTPDAKWRLTESRLTELTKIQRSILETAMTHVGQGGRLA
ncbi:MAG: RsmB/NOP family class I SAM-dependent RNA methyltransferase, partial [Marivivens sp.]|nr:RsmB/NOP family class I SAM-dependent RNA methyltransferase [Marivivens sp.]